MNFLTYRHKNKYISIHVVKNTPGNNINPRSSYNKFLRPQWNKIANNNIITHRFNT